MLFNYFLLSFGTGYLPAPKTKSDLEQTGKQRYKSGTDKSNTATGHELLHSLGLCLCVIKKQ